MHKLKYVRFPVPFCTNSVNHHHSRHRNVRVRVWNWIRVCAHTGERASNTICAKTLIGGRTTTTTKIGTNGVHCLPKSLDQCKIVWRYPAVNATHAFTQSICLLLQTGFDSTVATVLDACAIKNRLILPNVCAVTLRSFIEHRSGCGLMLICLREVYIKFFPMHLIQCSNIIFLFHKWWIHAVTRIRRTQLFHSAVSINSVNNVQRTQMMM